MDLKDKIILMGQRQLLVLLVLVALSGCSISKLATGAFADALSQGGDAYSTDNDIEFVGEAIPFALKTMESLLEKQPQHKGLLLSTARGFTQYAWVYVEQPANEIEEQNYKAAYALRNRALKLYLRARDYGLRGLAVSNAKVSSGLTSDPTQVLADTRAEDVALLYWTAAAWASAISLGKNRPDLVADLGVVEALIYRAFELDESFDQGAIHTFLIGYEMAKHGYNETSLASARQHLQRALELSNPRRADIYVTWAEAVSIPAQNKQEFLEMLNLALSVDVSEKTNQRLANLVMQRRARWLMDHVEYFFME